MGTMSNELFLKAFLTQFTVKLVRRALSVKIVKMGPENIF